jgi:hypothetical protein
MVDIVARDDQTAPRPKRPSRDDARVRPAERPRGDAPPRSDVGTIVLHWATALALIICLLTGLRVGVFGWITPRFDLWLSPILPQGELWTWHFLSGLGLFFCASAYLIYVYRGGLTPRNALKKLRIMLIPGAGRMRWDAINVGLHWVAYVLIVIMTATGILNYLGFGGWWVWIHAVTALVAFGYIFLHVLTHYLYGGWWQLFRLFRPAKLVMTRAARAYPLLLGTAVGLATVAMMAGIDWISRDTLVVAHVNGAPKIDGVLDDAVWTMARPVTIRTEQGANLGGTGESLVEARAVHDGKNIYFAFRWEDPTRSMKRVPLIKKEDGWHLLATRNDVADVVDYYEDKFAVGLSWSPTFGSGESTYMGTDPLPSLPKPLHGLGYHYTAPDNVMDVWQWKASRGGHLGRVDDQYFYTPREPTANEKAGKERYQAGYWNDPGRAFYSYNYKTQPPGGYRGPVEVYRLPKDWKATVAALGHYSLDPDSSDEEGSHWWMMEDESVPYSPELDAKIPVGTVIPGVNISGDYEGDRADLHGAAKWNDGHWSLETVRALRTGSKYDQDFIPGQDLYMWVNVFDHTQIRHTRHMRGVRIVTEP